MVVWKMPNGLKPKKGVLILLRATIGATITTNTVKSHRNYRGVMVKSISNSGLP